MNTPKFDITAATTASDFYEGISEEMLHLDENIENITQQLEGYAGEINDWYVKANRALGHYKRQRDSLCLVLKHIEKLESKRLDQQRQIQLDWHKHETRRQQIELERTANEIRKLHIEKEAADKQQRRLSHDATLAHHAEAARQKQAAKDNRNQFVLDRLFVQLSSELGDARTRELFKEIQKQFDATNSSDTNGVVKETK